MVVIFAVACESAPMEPAEPPFTATYSTEKLRIITEFSAELCAGNIALMDAQIHWLEQTVDGPREEPTWVRMYADDETIDACLGGTASDPLGCWIPPIVSTTWAAVSHELVHAYLFGFNDSVPVVLEEGVAVALMGTPVWSPPGNRENLDQYLLGELPVSIVLYKSGGHFAHWLFSEHGAPRVLDLYASVSRDISGPELEGVFEELFGASMADVLADYVASTKDYFPGQGPFSCGQGEPLEWVGGRVTWEGETTCADTRTIGRYGETEFSLWRRARLEITNPGTYDLTRTGGNVFIVRCLTTAANDADLDPLDDEGPVRDERLSTTPLDHPIATEPGSGLKGPVMLSAGVYELWVGQAGDDPDLTFSVQLEPL